VNIHLSDINVRLPGSPSPLFHLPHFQVAAGSRVLIHGPSGKGKTTMLNIVSGQFSPDSGRVLIGGTDLGALDEDARARFRRRHFGIVFQRWNLIDHLTVLENILLGIPEKSFDRRSNRATVALRKTGLEMLAARRAGALSPGEQQRVAVARMWAASPEIILADEPTSSLDGPGAEGVVDTLLQAAQGRTLVVVSHDPRIRSRFETVHDFSALIAPHQFANP
jgi:putative ABC transport system ATP-binding protein